MGVEFEVHTAEIKHCGLGSIVGSVQCSVGIGAHNERHASSPCL